MSPADAPYADSRDAGAAGLAGRVVLVAGGAGAVGQGIVAAHLAAGAHVVVPSRDQRRLDALRDGLGAPAALTTLLGDIGEPAGAEAVRDQVLDRFGRLDAVVASVGGWWQGADLVDVDVDAWQRVLGNNLSAQFVVARTFLPVLRQRAGTSYVVIVGDAAVAPVPGSGLVSVTGAAVLMLVRTLAAEFAASPVRINALLLGVVATAARRNPRPEWLTAAEVGAYAAYLASDAGAMVSGSVIPLSARPPVRPAG